MIKSKYIRDILSLLIEGHEFELSLRKQIEHLVDSQYSYTKAGLIVTFEKYPPIDEYKVNFDKILNGVKITSSELELGAQTSLFFDSGVISYLEIFSNSSVYPEHPLRDYRLSQEWLSKGGRIIEHP